MLAYFLCLETDRYNLKLPPDLLLRIARSLLILSLASCEPLANFLGLVVLIPTPNLPLTRFRTSLIISTCSGLVAFSISLRSPRSTKSVMIPFCLASRSACLALA
jgi:hypothetical protein